MTGRQKTGAQVLLLGADGFIGRQIAASLRAAGYQPLCSARRTSRLAAMGYDTLAADLTDPATHDPAFWRPQLARCAHVVNAAGLLTGSPTAFDAVHAKAPAAVYAALPGTATGVLISAIGIEADTPFARARRQGEATARAAPIPITLLRPGLVSPKPPMVAPRCCARWPPCPSGCPSSALARRSSTRSTPQTSRPSSSAACKPRHPRPLTRSAAPNA